MVTQKLSSITDNYANTQGYIGDNTLQFFYHILIALSITIIVTVVVTPFLKLLYEKREAAQVEAMKGDGDE